MPTDTEQRIAELEDAVKEKDRRIHDLKTDLDKANDLVERMREHVQDCEEAIEAWKEAFDMMMDADGEWTWAPWLSKMEEWHARYAELVRQWNRFVPEFNAAVRRQPVGRPLLASEAQQATVLKMRKAGASLRGIAEETNLGLSTVRTIIDRQDYRDRASVRHLERIRRDMGEERTWQSRKRVRDGLPRRINAVQQQSAELLKEAKGLK